MKNISKIIILIISSIILISIVACNNNIDIVKNGTIDEFGDLNNEGVTIGEIIEIVSNGTVKWIEKKLDESDDRKDKYTLVEAKWIDEKSTEDIIISFLVRKEKAVFKFYNAENINIETIKKLYNNIYPTLLRTIFYQKIISKIDNEEFIKKIDFMNSKNDVSINDFHSKAYEKIIDYKDYKTMIYADALSVAIYVLKFINDDNAIENEAFKKSFDEINEYIDKNKKILKFVEEKEQDSIAKYISKTKKDIEKIVKEIKNENDNFEYKTVDGTSKSLSNNIKKDNKKDNNKKEKRCYGYGYNDKEYKPGNLYVELTIKGNKVLSGSYYVTETDLGGQIKSGEIKGNKLKTQVTISNEGIQENTEQEFIINDKEIKLNNQYTAVRRDCK